MAYFQTTRDSPLFQTFQMDAEWHAEWARQIAAGHWAQDRPFFRAPLYPFFLAGAYTLTGGSFTGARVVQHLLGAMTCVLVLLVGRRAYGPRAGLIAGLVAAFYGPLMHFENELLTPVLEVFLLAAFLWLIALAMERPAAGRWLVAGIALGLCCTTRPTFLVLLPVALATSILNRRHASQTAAVHGKSSIQAQATSSPSTATQPRAAVPHSRLGWTVAFLLGIALPVAPVALHNRIAGGEWVLIASQGGVNFFIGNNPDSDGRTAVAPGADFALDEQFVDNVWTSSRSVAEKTKGRTLTDGDVSGYWFERGLAFWRDRPFDALRLTAKKAYYLLNGFEIPSLRSMYLDGQFSHWAAALTLCRGLAFPAGVILPLAILGLFLPAPNHRLHAIIRWSLVLYSIGVILFFVNSRLRMPVILLAILLAGHAASQMISRVRAVGPRRIAGTLATLAALIVLCNTHLAGVRQVDAANDAVVLGNAWQRMGRMDDAVVSYRQAVALDPDRAEAHHNLGLALLRLGRAEEALAALRRAATLAGDRPAIHNSLGTAFEGIGQADSARQEYETALHLLPDYYLAHVNLSRLALRQQDFGRAAAHARSAASLRPAVVQAHCLLAVALLASGDRAGSDQALAALARLEAGAQEPRLRFARTLEEVGLRELALAAYLDVLRLNPRNAEAHANLGALLFEMARFEEARAALGEAIRLRPDFGEAHYNLALLNHRLGDFHAAREHLAAAQAAGVQADPGFAGMLRGSGGG